MRWQLSVFFKKGITIYQQMWTDYKNKISKQPYFKFTSPSLKTGLLYSFDNYFFYLNMLRKVNENELHLNFRYFDNNINVL